MMDGVKNLVENVKKKKRYFLLGGNTYNRTLLQKYMMKTISKENQLFLNYLSRLTTYFISGRWPTIFVPKYLAKLVEWWKSMWSLIQERSFHSPHSKKLV
uniref:Uncharacterized protein n=1 Tax=Cacopsylla melanoneura TaxID=428564 RepID=A0A8D8XAE2_9HEMI